MTNVIVSPSGFLASSGLGSLSVNINAAPVANAVITFTSTFNSTTVTITDNDHGALTGDFVTFTSCELPSQLSSLVTLLVAIRWPNISKIICTFLINKSFSICSCYNICKLFECIT